MWKLVTNAIYFYWWKEGNKIMISKLTTNWFDLWRCVCVYYAGFVTVRCVKVSQRTFNWDQYKCCIVILMTFFINQCSNWRFILLLASIYLMCYIICAASTCLLVRCLWKPCRMNIALNFLLPPNFYVILI